MEEPAEPQGEALRARLEALEAECEDLRARLAQETARRNQLLGQRVLLERLLAERPQGTAPLRIPAWLQRLRAWRVRASPVPQPTVAAPASPVLRPLPNGSPPSVVLVLTWGLAGAELGRAIELLLAASPGPAVLPVFLSDSLDLEPFRRHRALVEVLPSPEQQARHAPDLDWPPYLRRRLALLARKWQAGRVVVLGTAARARLAGLLEGVPVNGELALFGAALAPAPAPPPATPGLGRPIRRVWSAATRRLRGRRPVPR
jgi:hypothetical protein